MDALILTCGTGGGHNAAAEALREELERRGDRATVMNPYSLTSQRRMRHIDQTYVTLAQKAPGGFGLVYRMGELYRRSGLRSPVYYLNHRAALALAAYLEEHPVQAIFCPHLYPAEIATQMKRHGLPRPLTLFVATDYTCIPFTEETDCDGYVIPSRDLAGEYTDLGVPGEKLYPLGIPVRRGFSREMTQAQARRELGLEESGTYYLLSGGSMGAGRLRETVAQLRRHAPARLAVVCGSNGSLRRELERQYGAELILMGSTKHMDLWLRACDVYFTKPGGLSSTEAAVAGVPLVHLAPIPGCETKNAAYYAGRGMSALWPASQQEQEALLEKLTDPAGRREMAQRQRQGVSARSAEQICELAHRMVEHREEGANDA